VDGRIILSKITFLVPLYNPNFEYLLELVKSFESQSCPNFKVIFIDDGSDNKDYLDRIESIQLDARFTFIEHERNFGISKAQNTGISQCKTEWIGMVDQDDLLPPDTVEKVLKFLEKNSNAAWIYTDEILLQPSGEVELVAKNAFNIVELEASMYLGHLQLFNKIKLAELLYFDSEFDGSQDHEIALRLSSFGYKANHISEALYIWRVNPKSFSKNKTKSYQINPTCIDASLRALNYGRSNGNFNSVNYDGVYTLENITFNGPISIIIPTAGKNRPKKNKLLLEFLIKSLVSSTDRELLLGIDLIIVTSDKDTSSKVINMMRKYPLKYQVTEDVGEFNFSRKISRGVSLAQNEEIIFVNDDIEIQSKNALHTLVALKNNYKLKVAGPIIVESSSNRLQSAGDYIGNGTIKHIGTGINLDTPIGRRISQLAREVSSITGAFMATTKTVYVENGGFDYNLKSSYQDAVFCAQIRRSLGRLAIFPQVKVTHIEGISRGKKVDDIEKSYAFAALKAELLLPDPFGCPNYPNNILAVNAKRYMQILLKIYFNLNKRGLIPFQVKQVLKRLNRYLNLMEKV